MERFQVPLYFAAMAAGAVLALLLGSDSFPDKLVDCLLLPLMFVTFLSVPLRKVATALQDIHFGALLLGVNFVAVPAVVWLLTRPFADSPLLLGIVLVLVAPCVDYVIVFSRLAGGDADRLVAWAPILLVVQMLALPLFLWLIAGHSIAADAGPFWYAFRLFILAPLIAAGLVQRFASATTVQRISDGLMVPLMMGTLAAVVATQLDTVREFGAQLGWLIPVYLGFAVVMGSVSWGVGSKIERGRRITLTFSGITRNSLIILPFALAIGTAITPAVVITQTLVELLIMVALVGLFRRTS